MQVNRHIAFGITNRLWRLSPQALRCVYEADTYEEAVRLAVSLGGDSDTLACITGSIAEAYYGMVPDQIARETYQRLPDEFIRVLNDFYHLLEE